MAAEELAILLVEDNPGDARLIEEMLRDVEELLQRVDGDAARTGSQLYHEQRLSAGLDRLADVDVDVILLDLGLPDSTGLETLATVADAVEFVPIVVLTGLRDEGVGIQAIQRGAQDYLVKEEVTADLLVRSIHHALERNRQERARARQVEQLTALNRLNRISQDVTHAVITTETREDLERAVCERFVADDEYPFAWIGSVDLTRGQITPRASAGAGEGYLDDTTVPVESDAGPQGPAAKAVSTHDVHVVNDMQTDPSFEPWREEAIERGYRSGAAVPVAYEDVLYGVLCLYATSPDAFTDPEVEILGRLGDVIGHAITAIERRDALVSDTVRELEFEVPDVGEPLVALTAGNEATVHVENVVHTGDHLIGYGRATGLSPTELTEAGAAAAGFEDVRVLDEMADGFEFELVSSVGPSLFEGIATRGGVVESATLADGEFRFVLQFPSGRDVRQLVELVQTHCSGAVPRAQRTVERREREVTDVPSILAEELTEKQRAALEAAYFAGYFEWPRTSSSEEIAERLGVTPATFTHHLRAAEATILAGVFANAETADGPNWSAWSSTESGTVDR